MLITVIILLLCVRTFAQNENRGFWSGWSLNLNGGTSLFYGDVEHSDLIPAFSDKNEWSVGYGIMLQKRFNPILSVRGQLFSGSLTGSKKQYNYWFESEVIETSVNLKADIMNIFRERKNQKTSIYLMAGVGLSHWHSQLKNFQTDEIINENGNDNTGSGLFGRTVEGVIPFGGGFEYNFNENWSANIEVTLRPVNSDKLDAKTGMFEYDFYSYNFIGISYHFRKKQAKEPDLIRDELAVEESEQPVEVTEQPVEEIAEEEPVLIVEPEPIIEEPKAEIVQQDAEKSIEDKILDKEYRTGLYESPWPGVSFTIQVAASRTYIEPTQIAKQYNLEGDIIVNNADGWYRYSVGNYIKYWKAREYRNILATRFNISDAFVVAYKDEERLMLSDLIESSGSSLEQAEQQIAKQQRKESQVSFSVQVLATTNGNISPNAIREMFEIDSDVIREEQNGLFQYTAGIFATYNDAAKLRNKLKARGISGAFVVGYKDGVRTEIRELMN
ncbi:MAG: outer membrane beta-barrel protein [Bacteroidales bacterium]|nr:outer membrane beta-barrel protein [Bacteroidales bacterium]